MSQLYSHCPLYKVHLYFTVINLKNIKVNSSWTTGCWSIDWTSVCSFGLMCPYGKMHSLHQTFSIFKPSRSDLLSPLWWFGHLGEDLWWLPYRLVVVWSLRWRLVVAALQACGGGVIKLVACGGCPTVLWWAFYWGGASFCIVWILLTSAQFLYVSWPRGV